MQRIGQCGTPWLVNLLLKKKTQEEEEEEEEEDTTSKGPNNNNCLLISINQSIFIYSRQPNTIVAKPVHIKRKKKKHTQHCTILPHTQMRKERN